MHAPKHNEVFGKLFRIINAAFWKYLFEQTNVKNKNSAENDEIGINNSLNFCSRVFRCTDVKNERENIYLAREENYINLQISKCSGGENVKGYNFSGIFSFW